MFSLSFTQNKVAEGIFTTAFQKDQLNPDQRKVLYKKRKLDQELNSSSELITWALDLSVDKLTGCASSKMTQMLPKV